MAAKKKKKKPVKFKPNARKKTVKKKPAKPVKKKILKSKVKPKAPKAPSFGEKVGEVTHYFPHVNAAVVKVKTAKLKTGDSLRFKGHTTDFPMKLESMQIDHKSISEARKGDEIGVQVPSRVREGDTLYRVK